MTLRGYQREAIEKTRLAVTDCRAQGRRQGVLIVSPTGSGKTVIGAELARRAVERGRRVLWAAHRTELVEQGARACAAMGLHVGVVAAGSGMADDPAAHVAVASLDTLNARDIRPTSDVVIIDEAHHACAATYRGILDHYRDGVLIGLTATPERSDGAGLGGDLFSRMVVVTTPAQCLEDGHLVPMQVIRPPRMLRPGQIAQRPVDAWMEHAQGRQTIVFCQSVSHAERVCEEFADANVISAVVTGTTPGWERSRTVEMFRRGDITVLCNVAVLTEGADFPAVDCIIIARGIGTPGLWLQMSGRGSRPAPGKTDCLIVDLRGVSHLHGHPYSERTYSLDGRGIAPLQTVAGERYCRVCGAPLDNETCADCGYVATERPVKVVGAKLSRYDWAGAAKFKDWTIQEKASSLRRWRAEGRVAGRKPSWAYVRFRVMFGEPASKEVTRASYARE